MKIPIPTLIRARGGVGVAVGLCCLTLGTGGAWAVVTATKATTSLHPPPAPILSTTPPASTKQDYAVFSFVDRQRRIYFQCALDGAPFRDCSSPVRYGPAVYTVHAKCKGKKGKEGKWCTYTTVTKRPALSAGPHVFQVRAVLGKVVGAPGSYTWTVLGAGAATPAPAASPAPAGTPASTPAATGTTATTPTPTAPTTPEPTGGGEAPVGQAANFTISGNPEGLLYPGAPPRRIPLALKNPNTGTIYVTGLTVTAASENPGCPVEENLLITQSNVSPVVPVVIPGGGTVTLPTQGITAPSIELFDLQAVNQDECKGAVFILRYSGSAHS